MHRPAVADAEDAVGGLALAPSVVEVHDVRRGRQVQPGAVRLKRSTTPRRAMELRTLLRLAAQLAAEYGLLRPMVGMVLLDGRAGAGQGVNEGQGSEDRDTEAAVRTWTGNQDRHLGSGIERSEVPGLRPVNAVQKLLAGGAVHDEVPHLVEHGRVAHTRKPRTESPSDGGTEPP